jgi:hypothetical protein
LRSTALNYRGRTVVCQCVFELFSHFQDIQGLNAYIDGGTGSLLFQAAMGGLLTLTYVLSASFAKFKTAIKARLKRVGSGNSSD